ALQKLGLPTAALGTFPTPFQQGMWPDWRARALGDVEDNAPSQWEWGGTESSRPDAVVIVYAYGHDPKDQNSLGNVVNRVCKDLCETPQAHGACVLKKIY